MALVSTAQEDFGGGIYRGRKAPANSVYDLVNGLIDDTGLPYRRGGSAYWSASDAGTAIYGIKAMRLAGPDAVRVLAWGADLYSFSGTTPVKVFDPARDYLGRPVGAGGVAVFPLAPVTTVGFQGNQAVMYGGSLLPAGGSTNQGTITVTAGSVAVTKAGGTTWVGNVDSGMFLMISGQPYGLVKSVDGANALTLVYPWSGTTASTGTYDIVPSIAFYILGDGSSLPADIPQVAKIYLGAAAGHLLVGVGNRVYIATSGFPFAFDKDVYHELPVAAGINGIEGVGDTAFVFTTAGMWAISNLSLDPIDAFGNVQHVVQQVSGEIVLWGEYGIAPWKKTGLIVPALDDIYIVGPDGSGTPITGDPENEKVRRLYRSYAGTADYTPGMAAVHAGHLMVPILNGTTLVDVLVCRLDRGTAWTRWAGHAAGAGYAVKPAETGAAPKLLGLAGQRVTDLTDCFTPTEDNATDADGTTSDFTMITRDLPTGANQPGLVHKIRARYELEGATGTHSFSGDPNGALASPFLAWASSMPTISSGKAFDTAGLGDATRPETFANGFSELRFDAVTLNNGENFGVGIRLTAHSAAANGYMFEIQDSSTGFRPRLYRGAAFTTVATGSLVTGVIDGIRITAQGSTITGYFRVAGVWTQVVQATDATYTAAGYPGFWVQDPTVGADLGATSFSWGGDVAVTPAYSSDQDGGLFTDLTETGEQNGGDGWATGDGSLYQWANVGKRRERIRFRLTVAGACSSFVLRTLELLTRPSGKQ